MAKENPNRTQKGKSLLDFPDDFVAIDIETTGLDPNYADIIELAAIRVTNRIVRDEFQTLVNPGYEISNQIKELTGITNKMLSKAPLLKDVLPSFLDFVGDSVVVGHNVNFDINFIYDSSMELYQEPFANDFVDTMRLCRQMFPGWPHYRLVDLVKNFKIAETTKHRAAADAQQTVACLLWMQRCANGETQQAETHEAKLSIWERFLNFLKGL